MKLEVEVIEINTRKNGKKYLSKHIEEREYPDSEMEKRHSEFCIFCGKNSYPDCRHICRVEGYDSVKN